MCCLSNFLMNTYNYYIKLKQMSKQKYKQKRKHFTYLFIDTKLPASGQSCIFITLITDKNKHHCHNKNQLELYCPSLNCLGSYNSNLNNSDPHNSDLQTLILNF